ncbi:protein aurora borealis-like [Haliotis rubra]|uniref:protein aurora borealis-like n=1 Tax=Haliotis rubra TaxID=36100 RepID=UPI001EE5A4CE|nr:protein aurora borealis-like [Haliotis rubra]XP_046579298.1 protein aurora borealis-like [Haliotis rubra]
MEAESCASETLDSRPAFSPVPHFDLNNVTPDKNADRPPRGCPLPFSKTQDSNTPSTSQRSPVHVRFGTCGLRSDTYLRHALSSPYHKHPSMVSVQTDYGSPLLFKTPIREAGSTPSSSRAKTPNGSRLHPGVANHLTPQSHVMSNPFDMTGDRVHFPGFSPGLFTVMSTPAGEDGKTFRWSIEHIAALNPANIEDMPEQQEHGLDREAEERAQQAISHYFASQLIVPSPWNAPERKYFSPCTPVTQSGANRPTQIFPEDLQGSIQKELNKLRKSQEVSCQTTLSLPVDFDMQTVLGEYMNSETTEETNQEALSTSSLRRKLFFQGETTTTLSPVKSETRLLEELSSPPASPLAQTTPEWDKQTYRTSSSGQFSSSPIKGPSEPFFRRTSSEADFLASPELSPINKKRSNRGAFCRSSGCGVPDEEESFTFTCNTKRRLSPLPMPDMSPIGCDPDDEYDIKRRLSPLPMPDVSPISCDRNDGGDLRQRLSPLPMPDMSPISVDGSVPRCRQSASVPNMSPIYHRHKETMDTQQLPVADVSPITFKSASEGENLGASYLPEPSSSTYQMNHQHHKQKTADN